MILSDREIRAALLRGALRITPVPPANAWSSTALNLTLDGQLSYWEPPGATGSRRYCCPHDPNYAFAELAAKYSREVTVPDEGHVVAPQKFVLGWTAEKIQLPHSSRIAARVEGKSSLARLGLGVHVTAPTIHAGFGTVPDDPNYVGSPIRLEIWIVGPLEIVLQKGMPICQLIFETVDGTPEKGYEGQFTIQGPQPSGSLPSTSSETPTP